MLLLLSLSSVLTNVHPVCEASYQCVAHSICPLRLSHSGSDLASELKMFKDSDVEVNYPPTHQERWSGCNGSRCFRMFVCLHVCGKVVGGWWIMHIFLNQKYAASSFLESEIAPGPCN